MADLIAFNQDSNNFAKPRLNLLDKDLFIKTEQMFKKNTDKDNTHSLSEESRSRIDGTDDNKSSPIFKTTISKSTQKKVISMSSISRLSTPRRSYKSNDPPDLTKVKMSALLYEITERTTQLAQPRSHITEVQEGKFLKSKVPKSTSHVIELTCPKVIHDSAPKLISFVSPNALKAIATQRIIELSQPRKDFRYCKLPRRKKQIRQSCYLRTCSLSEPMDYSRVKAKLLDSENDKLESKKLFQDSLQ